MIAPLIMASKGTLLRGAMRARRLPSQAQCFRYASTRAAAVAPSLQSRMSSTAAAEASTETASPFPFTHGQVLDSQQNARRILLEAAAATRTRNDWTEKEVSLMYHQPLLELAHQAVSLLAFLI